MCEWKCSFMKMLQWISVCSSWRSMGSFYFLQLCEWVLKSHPGFCLVHLASDLTNKFHKERTLLRMSKWGQFELITLETSENAILLLKHIKLICGWFYFSENSLASNVFLLKKEKKQYYRKGKGKCYFQFLGKADRLGKFLTFHYR